MPWFYDIREEERAAISFDLYSLKLYGKATATTNFSVEDDYEKPVKFSFVFFASSKILLIWLKLNHMQCISDSSEW